MSVVVSELIVAVERALICEAERDEMMDIDAHAFSFASAASKKRALRRRQGTQSLECGSPAGYDARRVSVAENNIWVRHGSSGPSRQKRVMRSATEYGSASDSGVQAGNVAPLLGFESWNRCCAGNSLHRLTGF